MTKNYIPTQYNIRNWGRIGHDTILKPSSKGNIVLSGQNASGKTSTMTSIYPLLIAGNLQSSRLFNSFANMSATATNKVSHRNRNDERTLSSSILNGTGERALHNANGQLITDRIAFASATLDNDTDAITFGVTVQIKDRKLPSNGRRWFIYRHETGTVPDIVSYNDANDTMLSLNDFTEVNIAKFGNTFNVFDTDSAYRKSLAFELYGIDPQNADSFLTTYAYRMQLIGSGSLISDKIKLDDLKNNLRQASPAIKKDTIRNVISSFIDEIKESNELSLIDKLISDLKDINDVTISAQFLSLIKTYYSKIESKEKKLEKINSEKIDVLSKINDINTDIEQYAIQKETAYDELAAKRATQQQLQTQINSKKMLLAELSLLNEKQAQFTSSTIKAEKLSKELAKLSDKRDALSQEIESLKLDVSINDKLVNTLVSNILPDMPDLSLKEKESVIKHDLKIFNKIEKKNVELMNADNNLSTLSKLLDKIINILSAFALIPGMKSSIEKIKSEFNSVTNNESASRSKINDEIKELNKSLQTDNLSETDLEKIQEQVNDVSEKLQNLTELKNAYESAVNKLENIDASAKSVSENIADLPKLNDVSEDIIKKQSEIDGINIPVEDIDQQVAIAEKVFNEISFKLNDLNHDSDLKTQESEKLSKIIDQLTVELSHEIDSFKNTDVASYQKFDSTFDETLIDSLRDVDFTPSGLSQNEFGHKLSKKIIAIHKSFAAHKDSAIEDLMKFSSKLINTVSEFSAPSSDDTPNIDGRIAMFLENAQSISIDASSQDTIDKLIEIQNELINVFEMNKQFKYDNNHAVSEFVTELSDKHNAFNELLDNAENIMSDDTSKNVIRINMTHKINNTLMSDDMKTLIRSGNSVQEQTRLVKSMIDPFMSEYANSLDELSQDEQFLADIADKFDYRKWVDIEFLIANANSDNFDIVTQNTLNSGSGGEKTYIIMIPLFTMLTLHLAGAKKESIPKLALFDELAHVLDDINTTALLSIIDRFGLSFFATTPASKENNLARGGVPLSIYFVTPGNGSKMNNYTKIFEYKNGKNTKSINL